MKKAEELVSEMWFCDPSTHLFTEIRIVRKSLQPKTLGIYGSRLDSANLKLRYAAEHHLRLLSILKGLEIGEFIYFADEDRLAAHASLEADLVFLRASIDLVASAWWAYHTDTTNVDSINVVLKKIEKGIPWIEELTDASQIYWNSLAKMHRSDQFNWLSALVGSYRGQSLRDMALHRTALEIDPIIDDRDRGLFSLTLDAESKGPAIDWLNTIFSEAGELIQRMHDDILIAEEKFY